MAGLWTRWQGVRKVKDGPGDFELYGFSTTKPNALIAPVHEKAMPVIPTTQEETGTWLAAPWSEARRLQRTVRDRNYTPRLTDDERNSCDHIIEVTRKLYWAPFIKLVYSTHPIASSERHTFLDLVLKAAEYRQQQVAVAG